MSVILSHQLNRLRYLGRPQLTQTRQMKTLFNRGGNIKPRNQTEKQFRQDTFLNYLCAIGISFLGLGFWSVPLYRVFCESVGLGNNLRGNTVSFIPSSEIQTLNKFYSRLLHKGRILLRICSSDSPQFAFMQNWTVVISL